MPEKARKAKPYRPKGKPNSAEFKARLVLEALQGAKAVGKIAAERDYLHGGLLKRRSIDIEGVPSRPGKR